MSPEQILDGLGSFDHPNPPTAPILLRPTPFRWRDPSTIPRRQLVFGTHLIRGFVAVTVAPGGVGKSSLAIGEVISMACGKRLLGVGPQRPLRAWYVNLEDPREEIERRIAAVCLHFKIDPASLEDRLFFDGREMEIIIAHQARAGFTIATPVEDALVLALTAGQFDVLILDPFVSTHRVTENDNMAIDAVAKTFGRIAGKANCAVELIHHVRKTGGAEITAEDGRGASALIAAARSVRVLNPMSKDEGESSGVGEERRFYFRSDIGKANLAPPSTKATWFKLQSVSLGNGTPDAPFDDGDPVGVVTPWQWPEAFDGITADDLRAAQAKVAMGRCRENSQAKDWVGVPIAEALGLDVGNKAHVARIKTLLKTWINDGIFVVVKGKDEKRNLRQFVELARPRTNEDAPP
jgi:AAA domain